MEKQILRISFSPITINEAIDIANRFNLEFKNYIFVKKYSKLKSAIIFYKEKIIDFFPKDYQKDEYNPHEFVGDIKSTKKLKEIELLIELTNGKTN